MIVGLVSVSSLLSFATMIVAYNWCPPVCVKQSHLLGRGSLLSTTKSSSSSLFSPPLYHFSQVAVPISAIDATLSSYTTTSLAQSSNSSTTKNDASSTDDVQQMIAQQYPMFWTYILSKNNEVWKTLNDVATSTGYTLFVPTDAAMEQLGSKKLLQLQDDRNGETVEKMASFHAINEPVSSTELYNSGGVVTLGGIVNVERSRSGGFMGGVLGGGQEDGTVLVGNAKVIKTMSMGSCIVHETNGLISPSILWRYFDRLRIPGSK
jgi:uncharacterized surface protein with fasciclin (FAS1) repeats